MTDFHIQYHYDEHLARPPLCFHVLERIIWLVLIFTRACNELLNFCPGMVLLLLVTLPSLYMPCSTPLPPCPTPQLKHPYTIILPTSSHNTQTNHTVSVSRNTYTNHSASPPIKTATSHLLLHSHAVSTLALLSLSL